jgi:hypothetical protein
VRIPKPRGIRQGGYVRMEEMRDSYIILAKKFKKHRSLDTIAVDGRVLKSTSMKHDALESIRLT